MQLDQKDDSLYKSLDHSAVQDRDTLVPEPDMLTEIFDAQTKLMERYLAENYGYESVAEAIYNDQDYLIAESCNFIAEEAFELKRNFNYKPWKHLFETNLPCAKEELVDILHFVLQSAIFLGMSADELHNRYLTKNKVNHNRQDQEGGYSKDV